MYLLPGCPQHHLSALQRLVASKVRARQLANMFANTVFSRSFPAMLKRVDRVAAALHLTQVSRKYLACIVKSSPGMVRRWRLLYIYSAPGSVQYAVDSSSCVMQQLAPHLQDLDGAAVCVVASHP